MLGVKNIELMGKTITMWVYVPAEYTNTVVQMVIMDQGYQGVYSPGLEVPAGEWTKIYLKLLSSRSDKNEKYPGARPSLAGYDAEGNKIGKGAYSSDKFNSYAIDTIEIRSLSGEIGDNATVFIDSIDWED